MKQIRYFVQIHTYFLLGAVFRVNFADAVYLYQNFTTLYVKSAQNSESRDISRQSNECKYGRHLPRRDNASSLLFT